MPVKSKKGYAFAVLGEPKYAFNFDHFDYVNPAAPKGGSDDAFRHWYVLSIILIATLRGKSRRTYRSLYDTLYHRMMNPEAITR